MAWTRRSESGETWAAYSKVWSEWFNLVWLVGAELGESEARLLVIYFVSRHIEGGGSVSAITRKMAGLAFFFKLQGRPDFTKDFWVKQAIKGYSKCHYRKDTGRLVSFSILQDMYAKLGQVCLSVYEKIWFKAAFSLAFFGAFRVGELVSPSKRVVGDFRFQDVGVAEDRVVLWLRKSKTDQRGVELFPLSGSEVCPYKG